MQHMASGVRTCRLCCSLVTSNRAVSIFSATGIQQQWARRIEALLSVTVTTSDGLPGYICRKCKLRIESLEKAHADLKAFKEMANASVAALKRAGCPVKRTKCTSSEHGVSPDTARERPRSKLPRKRLDFNSEIHTNVSV